MAAETEEGLGALAAPVVIRRRGGQLLATAGGGDTGGGGEAARSIRLRGLSGALSAVKDQQHSEGARMAGLQQLIQSSLSSMESRMMQRIHGIEASLKPPSTATTDCGSSRAGLARALSSVDMPIGLEVSADLQVRSERPAITTVDLTPPSHTHSHPIGNDASAVLVPNPPCFVFLCDLTPDEIDVLPKLMHGCHAMAATHNIRRKSRA